MEFIITWLADTIGRLGYTGIIILMFLESTLIPIPSEIIIPPAGYLVSQGKMNIWLVIFCGIAGSLFGALFNYIFALWLGRPLLIKYGKYIFLPLETFDKVNTFFLTHGEISTFTGRLIPGLRHCISIPAGLAKMDLFKFSFYTTIGSSIWVVILAYIGYIVGNNMDLVNQYSRQALIILFVCLSSMIFYYIYRHRKKTHS